MGNFKIEQNAGQHFLVIQGQKGQQISEREYYAISTGQVPGLLRGEMIRKGNTFKLVYNISGFISLREFLVNPLNKQSFARLLKNILNNLKALQRAYYNYQFILMDMNAAMVNPTTQQVSFVYVPITFYNSGTDLKNFLLSIIQCCSFVPGENTDYVRDYIRILNNGINFSVFDLEEYVKNLEGNQGSQQAKKCTRCGTPIPVNVNFCSSCGMKISGVKIETHNGVYDPAKAAAKPQPQQPPQAQYVPQPPQAPQQPPQAQYVPRPPQMPQQPPQAQYVPQPPQVPQQPPQAQYVPQPEQASSKYAETIAHSYVAVDAQPVAPVVQQQRKVFITRCKTGEQFPINAECCRIGKDPHNCEYCIRDNSTISRCHALIKFVNGKWIINDLNSTNKTFVNNQQAYPYADIELHNGANIKIANEMFVFNHY